MLQNRSEEPVEREVRRALAVLEGRRGSPHTVARMLDRWGFRGRRYQTCCCPLANYLKSIFGDYLVQVGVDVVHVKSPERETVVVILPVACKFFVEEFDHGRYPWLEQEETNGEKETDHGT